MNRQPNEQRDEGAVLVWVALMLAVLLGVGALVIDIGRLYVERRELQNGADAAALAVAQDCAEGDCQDEVGTAQNYADLNANDGTSAIEPGTPCGNGVGLPVCSDGAPSGTSGATGWVRVGTSTLTSGGNDEVSFLLAPIISALTGRTVRASATAAWGPIGAATTLPFTFSRCEFDQLPKDDDGFPVEGTYTMFAKAGGSPSSTTEAEPGQCRDRAPSGGFVPGGFGWLFNPGNCSVELNVGETTTADNQPGNANRLNQRGCSESLIRNQEVLVPLHSDAAGNGRPALYTIVGFVGFRVTAYQVSGNGWPDGFSCNAQTVPPTTGNNLRCFQGTFTRFYSSQGEFGNSEDFGARVIKMVE